MTNTGPSRNKKIKKILSFNSKHLFLFLAICFTLLVILTTILRATQQRLMKTATENAQQVQHLSVQLNKLQNQQTRYELWWKNERRDQILNNLYKVSYRVKLANVYFKLGEYIQSRQILQSIAALFTSIHITLSKELKQKIDTTIDQLSLLSQIDINKTIAMLDQINQTIENLPVLNQSYLKQAKSKTNPINLTQGSEKKNVFNFWPVFLNQLKQLVIIHRAEDNEDIILKANTGLIKQMLIQKILQMQLALLRNDYKLYQHDTSIVINWLKEYFSLDHAKVSIIIKQLQTLRAYTLTLKPQLVDFSGLIKLIDQSIEAKTSNNIGLNAPTENKPVKIIKNSNQTKKLPHAISPITPTVEV